MELKHMVRVHTLIYSIVCWRPFIAASYYFNANPNSHPCAVPPDSVASGGQGRLIRADVHHVLGRLVLRLWHLLLALSSLLIGPLPGLLSAWHAKSHHPESLNTKSRQPSAHTPGCQSCNVTSQQDGRYEGDRPEG